MIKDPTLDPPVLNKMLIDMQRGVHPGVEIAKVIHTFETYGDCAVKAVISRFLKKEVENRSASFSTKTSKERTN